MPLPDVSRSPQAVISKLVPLLRRTAASSDARIVPVCCQSHEASAGGSTYNRRAFSLFDITRASFRAAALVSTQEATAAAPARSLPSILTPAGANIPSSSAVALCRHLHATPWNASASSTQREDIDGRVLDAEGLRDEAIRAETVYLIDQSGKAIGPRPTKWVLSQMDRQHYILVITRSVKPRDAITFPVAKIMLKEKLSDEEKAKHRSETERRQIQPKVKQLTVGAAIEEVDLHRVAQHMHSYLGSGDIVNVVVEPPERKHGIDNERRPPAATSLLADRVIDFLEKEFTDVAKMGRVVANAKGGKETVFIPLTSKKELHEHKDHSK